MSVYQLSVYQFAGVTTLLQTLHYEKVADDLSYKQAPLAPERAGEETPAAASGTILVITQGNNASSALESLLHGLTQALSDSNLSLLYFDSRPRPGRTVNELPSDDYLSENGVAGIVLWSQSPADMQALHRLRAFAPLILVDRQVSGFETHSVVFDNFLGGFMVAEHLLKCGHRRIGFLTDDVFAETVQQRWRGYVEALKSAGLLANPGWNAFFEGTSEPPYSSSMRILLQGGGQPLTAVVCSNDTVALRFLHFLRREGLRVPEDIAVTGFGNLLPNSMEAMRLTTILQPFEEAGRSVGRILLAQVLISDKDRSRVGDGKFEHVQVPVRLVVRDSSGIDEQAYSHSMISSTGIAR